MTSNGSAGMVDAFPFNSATFIPHIGRVSTRPVPGHVGESTGTFALPVSKKRPGRGSWSTARLTAPRIPGALCHSSIGSGSRNDRSTASGSRVTASAEPGRSSAHAVRVRAHLTFGPGTRHECRVEVAGQPESTRRHSLSPGVSRDFQSVSQRGDRLLQLR